MRQKRETSKQSQFVTGWSINDQPPQYEALKDPNASYYFLQPSVKQRLKKFKKALQLQSKSPSVKQLQSLLQNKIKEKPPKDSFIYQIQDKKHLNNSRKLPMIHRKIVTSSFQNFNKLKVNEPKTEVNIQKKQEQKDEGDSNKNPSQSVAKANQQSSVSVSNQYVKRNKLVEELHRKKREKFLQFIEQRKQALRLQIK